MTRADLEVIITAFTATLSALTEQMANLENRVHNANNNMNQQRDSGGEQVSILRGVNNHRVVIAENLSSKKKKNPIMKR